jgi:type II secretory pathway pseudopilin PulG
MKWFLLALLVVGLVGVLVIFSLFGRKRRAQELADAREEALRWYERLGGQVMNLSGGDDPAAKQALVDAGERYNAAGAQLDRATTPKQYELARETALEGLAYVRGARTAMGIDPGPELPPLAGARQAGQLTKEREVEVQGQHIKAGPRPGGDTPYYYPGGMVGGRPVPSGWYSQPLWKTALAAGAGAVGSMLLFDALLSPAWGDTGYDAGFEQGLDYADDHGWDPGGDGGDAGGGDAAGDGGGGDFFGGGDWGGGDFGGGDWGGGDFGGGDFGGDF